MSGFCTPARTTRPKGVRCNRSHRPATHDDGDAKHQQPVFRVDEVADKYLASECGRNRKRHRRRAEHPAQRLLGDHRKPEGQQQAKRGILAIETAKQKPFDHETDQRDDDGRERAQSRRSRAEPFGHDDREVRTERVERAVREVDQPAEREDQRQAERDQQVIRAGKQAV